MPKHQPKDHTLFAQYALGSRAMRKSTVDSYLSSVREVERFIEKPLREATTSDIEQYVVSLKAKDTATNTQRNRLIGIRSFLDWIYRPNPKKHPMNGMILPSEEVKDPLLITPNELVQLVLTAAQPTFSTEWSKLQALRNAAMICVFADTGMRVSELIGLTMSSIVEDKSHFKAVVRGKTGERIIPFSKLTEQSFIAEYWLQFYHYRKYIMRAKNDAPLFMTFSNTGREPEDRPLCKEMIQQMIAAVSRRSPVSKRVYPHLFRHYYGTYSRINGTDLEVLRQRMGHASIETTQRYVHLADIYGDPKLEHGPNAALKAPIESAGFVKIQKAMRSDLPI